MKTILKVLAFAAAVVAVVAAVYFVLRPKQEPAYITLDNGEDE